MYIPAAEFELFHDVADLLEAVYICMVPPHRVGNHLHDIVHVYRQTQKKVYFIHVTQKMY